MKNKILVAMIALLVFATASVAQVRPTRTQQKSKTPEERAEMLTKRLSKRLELSPEQSQKLGVINKETALEMSAIRKEIQSKKEKNETFDKNTYRQRIKALQEQREQKTIALLNEKQKAEYIKLKTEFDEKRKQRQKLRRQNHNHKRDTGMWLDDEFELDDLDDFQGEG